MHFQRTGAFVAGMATITIVVGTLLIITGSGSGGSSAKAAPATDPPPAIDAAIGYQKALQRVQDPEELDVQETTPASDTRLVTSDGPDEIYLGQVEAKDALCLSIEHRKSERLTTTCGDRAAIQRGQLLLVRGGEESTRLLLAGVAPLDSTTVTITTQEGRSTGQVTAGLYVARTETPPLSLEFEDSAGSTTGAVSLSGASLGQ